MGDAPAGDRSLGRNAAASWTAWRRVSALTVWSKEIIPGERIPLMPCQHRPMPTAQQTGDRHADAVIAPRQASRGLCEQSRQRAQGLCGVPRETAARTLARLAEDIGRWCTTTRAGAPITRCSNKLWSAAASNPTATRGRDRAGLAGDRRAPLSSASCAATRPSAVQSRST
jgi:hypothetical protein